MIADALRQEVSDFLEREPKNDLPFELEPRFKSLVAAQARLHRAGLATVSWPSRFGGRDYSPGDAAEVALALGRGRAPETINFVALEVVAPGLIAHASEAQLLDWLPPMASADQVWCQLFSEPDSGSDLASLRTRATKNGRSWQIDGQKTWCTWGQFADRGLLLARTGTPESRHRGLSAFVIDMHSPGVEVRPLRTMTGIAEFSEVFFGGVEIPQDQMVGEKDGGWKVATVMLSAERGTYAVRRAAVVLGALSELVAMAREQGVPTREARRLLVSAFIAMKLLERRIGVVVESIANGIPMGFDAAVTKLMLTNTEQAVFAACLEYLGLGGLAWTGREHRWIESYLYSRAASIYGGTSQIQRNIIGEKLLGLPREPVEIR
jgi:alkylation response protein AidB-like acyl-CoA dehydrogenase